MVSMRHFVDTAQLHPVSRLASLIIKFLSERVRTLEPEEFPLRRSLSQSKERGGIHVDARWLEPEEECCRRFGPARTLNRLVNLTLRVPAQMG
jgi:hypothetical protein